MIPIFVIARDRFDCLKELSSWLIKAEYDRVTIIDNGSTYIPLLEWYEKECPFNIERIDGNGGHMIPWNGNLVPRNEFYCVTDCDVVPDENCPHDAVDHLKRLLDIHSTYPKAGLSLRIDDLPGHYAQANAVRAWEDQFWRWNIGNAFHAPTDTTFAVYRPYDGSWDLKALRSMPPYQARHLGWYIDNANLTPDVAWYHEHMNKDISDWTKQI